MFPFRISRLSVRPRSAVVLRYGTATILVAVALGIALFLRHDNLPHPFISFSLAAIAITFWSAGTGPGLVALFLSYLALSALFVPVKILGSSSEPYLAFTGFLAQPSAGSVPHVAGQNDCSQRPAIIWKSVWQNEHANLRS